MVSVCVPVFFAVGGGLPTSTIFAPELASSGVQVHATVPAGRALAAGFLLSSDLRLVTSQTATPAMPTTAMAEPITACRCRRLRAAAARSAISFSSRARAAARCRSLIDDTVFLLLFICLGRLGLVARGGGCRRGGVGPHGSDGQGLDQDLLLGLHLAAGGVG